MRKVQLGPVVRKVPDNAIHWINLYSLDSEIQSLILIHLIAIYPMDSAIGFPIYLSTAWIVIYPVESAIKCLNNWSLIFPIPNLAKVAAVRHLHSGAVIFQSLRKKKTKKYR